MEEKQYQAKPVMRGPGGHGMRGGGEKAKDFTGTWKKLISYCQK